MRKKRARQKRAKKRQADAQQMDCSSSAVKTSVDDSTTKNSSKPLQHILQNKEVLTQSHVLMTLKTEIGTCRILTNRVICPDETIEANHFHVWNIDSFGHVIDYEDADLAKNSVLGTEQVVRTPFEDSRQHMLLNVIRQKWTRMMHAIDEQQVDFHRQVQHWKTSNRHCYYKAMVEHKQTGARIVIGALGFVQSNGVVLYQYGGSRKGFDSQTGQGMSAAKAQSHPNSNGTHIRCRVHPHYVVSYSGDDIHLCHRLVNRAFT